jgi:hypothetical protein
MERTMYAGNPTALVLCMLSVMPVAAVCRAEDAKEPEKVLRHAVFFKFNDGTSGEDVGKVLSAFDALPKKIDSIKGYERGKNVSSIGFDDGYTHCFLVTFADEAGRAKYLPHPEHKAFAEMLGPHLDKVFVVDYWGKPEKTRAERELKHALFLKFKESATDDEVKAAEEALAKLPSQCDTIKAFEWGKNNSSEKHDEGFTHCFMFTFDDVEGLKSYASSPAHKAVVEKVLAVAEKGRILDFWTKEKGE